ncbi:hypothetical protein CORC01_05300 [Colletotrichum orchidophilum]|uniref:Uncharacterized protein n=1 Tax=Colletotrichum orchidophilum TaxID=1209926 RepID=A0A1G4BDN5_9PEZI|nr:uncharacterized protein CORC01_05300 [Colletotrichum orchidophilum]OHE99500.1 hypothetical protein CORC01_05300 [Colletotrichum orchidophilum]
MRQNLLSIAFSAVLLSWTQSILTENAVFQPCPILRAYYPVPTVDKDAETIKSSFEDFGEIMPNLNFFSVVLFSGSKEAEEDPVFFECNYTAPKAPKHLALDSGTIFPFGTLTQRFNVYSWLVGIGD